jgi:transcriptional regulator with AAA-type ATPase domain
MKNVYITWHYTTHGVAYFKHILSEFYRRDLPNKSIVFDNLNQEELNAVFDNPTENGFLFNEVIYLTASQVAFDKLSTRRFNYTRNVLQDSEVVRLRLTDVYEQIINENTVFDKIDKELEFVQNKYPDRINDFKSTIWRNIQHYPIEQQIKWLTEMSNFKNVYQGKFREEVLNVNDLRNEKEIADKVSEWAKRYFEKQKQDTQYFINVSLGSSETQVVWHILAESGLFPKNTHFLKTYDDKTKSAETSRFKLFSIKEIPVKLISNISESFKIYPTTQSPQRELVNKKMEIFLKSGFSILLIGERGIGKSKIAGEAKKRIIEQKIPFQGEIIETNCASFDDDSKAESELFGYKKGAFTGANTDKKGLIEAAENGILFLDEIHHLSRFVQAKLMKALQTDEYNRLSIRRMGDDKEQKIKDVRLIFATNKTVVELRECLLPDFYDRIVQHVIYIPSLREIPEDREKDWKTVWKNLKFAGEVPNDTEMMDWIKRLDLYGNFRDLQKIAMYYKAFKDFDSEIKKMLDEKTAFQYVKNEFEKYHSPQKEIDNKGVNIQITETKTANNMIVEFQHKLQDWAINKYGSRTEAAKQLGVTEKTLNNWKNKK